jgi:hypothetical protein
MSLDRDQGAGEARRYRFPMQQQTPVTLVLTLAGGAALVLSFAVFGARGR